MRRAALPGLLLLLAGCSRPSSETNATSQDAPALSAQGSSPFPIPSLRPESPGAPAAPPVLTPEDAEEDAAQRITEQNLESELDRLEREIQAE